MAPLCTVEGGSAFYSGEEVSSTPLSSSSFSLTPSTTEESTSLSILPNGRRTVSFSAGAVIHWGAVLHLDDYSEAEKCDCWYQFDEMREIRKEVKDTVALMNQNVLIDELSRFPGKATYAAADASVTTRGLEGKTRVGKRHRKETRFASLAAVFDEQTLQENDGVCDPTMIAMAYAEYSYPVQVAAFQRAVQYQEEAAAMDQNSPDKAFGSADSSRRVNTEGEVGPIKYEFKQHQSTLSSRTQLKQDKMEDTLKISSFSPSIEKADIEINSDATSSNGDENHDVEYLENGSNTDVAHSVGPLRIRDRFSCLITGSASNRSTNSLIGAFRVVQI
jgi:hypothetical protein